VGIRSFQLLLSDGMIPIGDLQKLLSPFVWKPEYRTVALGLLESGQSEISFRFAEKSLTDFKCRIASCNSDRSSSRLWLGRGNRDISGFIRDAMTDYSGGSDSSPSSSSQMTSNKASPLSVMSSSKGSTKISVKAS
jgi:hypothetical protein